MKAHKKKVKERKSTKAQLMAHKVVQLSGEGKGWSGIGGDVDLCVICMAVSESHGGGGLSPGVAH